MLNKKERVMKAIVAELQRQYDEHHLSVFNQYPADNEYDPRNKNAWVEIEGFPDIGFLADAVMDVR